MNIVETEAKSFAYNFLHTEFHNTLSNLKSTLQIKLYDFNSDRDKLDFLKSLRNEVELEKQEHQKKCDKSDCSHMKGYATAFFAIDQEIESTNKYYIFEPLDEDKFTPEEESNIHQKLNDIIERLNNQGLGQEIIFEEIESLKSHFDLGKKTWQQLLKGKLVDLTIDKLIDITIMNEIYSQLGSNFDKLQQLLNVGK